MNADCPNPNCHIHDGETCVLGHPTSDCCEVYSQVIELAQKADSQRESQNTRVPWSGSALGLSDLINLCPRARTLVVGVLGSHNAGKTSLLLGNYLNCLQGKPIAQADFAGSWTLGAWEALASWTKFDDASRQPHFPPHTSRIVSRCPGLLHIALRRPGEKLLDVLLTDAPGEWFTNWAIHAEAAGVEGARWTVKLSDAFLLFADCEKLHGGERGSARQELRQLIERLAPLAKERPVTLVWAKADKVAPNALSPSIRQAIRRALNENIPHAKEAETSTNDNSTLVSALSSVLEPVWTPSVPAIIHAPIIDHQPFVAFRGHHEYT